MGEGVSLHSGEELRLWNYLHYIPGNSLWVCTRMGRTMSRVSSLFNAVLHVTKELTSLLPDKSGLLCRSLVGLFVPVHGRHVSVRHADVDEKASLGEVFAEVGICEADVVSYAIYKSTIHIKL